MSNSAILEEVWFAKLSALSGVEQEVCRRLWSTFVRQVEARLAMGGVLHLGWLGVWSCVLQDEYVAQLPSLDRYLMPPRLRLVIHSPDTMEGGSPLSHQIATAGLAESVATLTGVTLAIAAEWLTTISTLATQLLEARREVLLPSLGLLRPLLRAEPSLVEGFVLQPSRVLICGLNKSFSMFMPVPLVNDVASEGLTTLDVASLEVLEEPGELEVRWQPALAAEDESILQVEATGEVAVAESMTLAAEANEQVEESRLSGDVVVLEEGESIPISPASRKSAVVFRWLLGGLLLLSIVLGVYHLMFRIVSQGNPVVSVHTSAIPDPKKPKVLDTVSDEVELCATQPESVSAVDSLPSREEVLPLSPVIKPKAQGAEPLSTLDKALEAEVVTLKAGEGLMQISLRKYGHKVFWVYIYEENRAAIANYNNIPVGTRLMLPSARKYGISARDTNSINRALVLQRALLRE